MPFRDGDPQIAEGMVHPGQAVLDLVLVANPVEDVPAVVDVLLARGKLDAVVGENGVDPIGNSLDQGAQELRGLHLAALSTSRTKANLLVRAIATNRRNLPSSVRTSARSTWK